MRRYNFHCHDCKKDFRKNADLIGIDTPYGKREGIVCPLCGGRAEAKGVPSLLGGESPNGIHDETPMLEL